MEAHKRFVGRAALQERITLEDPRIKGYFAALDEAMLRRVRADVGVERVYQHGYLRL